jgi:hypothetical protein
MNLQIVAAQIRSESRRFCIPSEPLAREAVLRSTGADSLRTKATRAAHAALLAEIDRQRAVAAERKRRRETAQPPTSLLVRFQASAVRSMDAWGMYEHSLAWLLEHRYQLGTRRTIAWTVVPEAVYLSAGTRSYSDSFCGRGVYRYHPVTIYEHHIFIAPGALSGRYARLGILWVGGLLTLAARPCAAPGGITAYEAVWLKQARGCHIRSVRGYITVRDGIAVHGETLRGAVHILAARPRGRTRLVDLPADVLYRRVDAAVRRKPDAIITLVDAERAGYCDAGVYSYCYRAGIEDALADGQITAKRLGEALARHWDTLAAALLIRVVERRTRRVAA